MGSGKLGLSILAFFTTICFPEIDTHKSIAKYFCFTILVSICAYVYTITPFLELPK